MLVRMRGIVFIKHVCFQAWAIRFSDFSVARENDGLILDGEHWLVCIVNAQDRDYYVRNRFSGEK